jgi:disulfide bond formation protein DsbB
MSSDPRLASGAIALASAVVLGMALISQYVFGLEPCQLCLWQRWPYVATIALGILGVIFFGMPPVRQVCVALAGAAFLVGAGIAGFHAGVEYGWWEGLPGCSVPAIEKGMTVEEVKKLLASRTNVVPCDEPAWTLLGLSMAGYNVLVSLALAAATIWALATRRA